MAFSTLYISGRYAKKIMAPIRSKLNFKQLLNPEYREKLKTSIERRNPAVIAVKLSDVDDLIGPVEQLIKYKEDNEKTAAERVSEGQRIKIQVDSGVDYETVDKIVLNQLKERLTSIQASLWDLEDQIVPKILNLPNIISDDVPNPGDNEIVKESIRRPEDELKAFKILDYVKLNYINEGFYSSMTGPNAIYGLGKIGLLNHALIDYFSHRLRCNGFIDFSGLDFVKSAVVEAVRDRSQKDFANDAFRIKRGHKADADNQQMHLSGDGSLESMAAYICKRHKNTKDDLKLFAAGCEYNKYDHLLVQSLVVRTCSLLKGEDANIKCEQEMDRVLHVIWNSYEDLKLMSRVKKVNSHCLSSNEYIRYDIETYKPSSGIWMPSGSVSNYTNFIPLRLGIENNAHLISAVAVNTQPVMMSIVESNQGVNAKFTIPGVLEEFIIKE